MTQLILDVSGDAVQLPESQKGGYNAALSPLQVSIEMISGRMTRELRGKVWVLSYQYGFFDDDMKKRVIAACEKGINQEIRCGFLTQESNEELTYSDFLVTNFNRPKFMWSRQQQNDGTWSDVPLWGDFSIELREVVPHD